MKKTVFLTVLAVLLLTDFYAYGQELEPKLGSNFKYGFIDKTGKEVIPFKYQHAKDFSEGLARVQLNNKWGYIDKTGKEVISFKYADVGIFSEGLAAVQLNDKWGFIDKSGKEVIPFKYDLVWYFSEGTAGVKLNGKWGFIDKTGAAIVPVEYASYEKAKASKVSAMFSNFAKNYVEQKINEWQQKGEFEKTADWQQRVNENARKAKAAELVKEAEQAYVAECIKKLSPKITLGVYDADNEVYLVKNDKFGDMLVPVPHSEAQAFKTNWNSMSKTPTYFIENDGLALAEMTFKTDNKTYKYSNQASLNYSVAQIDYKFDPIDVNVAPSTTAAPKGKQTVSTVNLSVGKSEVDINIPATNVKNDKTFAVIIANENYRRESQVIFAKNDGETLKKYCTQTLGLPEKNIHFVADATLNDIRGEIDWISQVASAYNGEASIIFYYAGHGIPDENSKTAYLLPIDGYGSNVKTGYKLDDLYQTLGNMPAKNITVLMDACFSGAQRSGEILASARGVAIKVEQGAPVGNMVVFSAAQGDETAYPYKEKEHGMFTYFLLKKLQETKGEVTLGELGDYITTNVKRESIVSNNKSQTPTVTPAATMGDKWKGLKLK